MLIVLIMIKLLCLQLAPPLHNYNKSYRVGGFGTVGDAAKKKNQSIARSFQTEGGCIKLSVPIMNCASLY